MEGYKQSRRIVYLQEELDHANQVIADMQRQMQKSLKVRRILFDDLQDSQELVEQIETSSENSISEETEEMIGELKEKNKELTNQLKAMKRGHENFSTQMTENLDALRTTEDKVRDLEREKQ